MRSFFLANNFIPLTNGALGIKGLPQYTNLWWTVDWHFSQFSDSESGEFSFGRALKAIREDEIAAQTMGINPFRMKLLAFAISGFAGVAGVFLLL